MRLYFALLPTLLLLFISISTVAQTDEIPANFSNRWMLSPVFSPGVSVLHRQNDAVGDRIPIGQDKRFLFGLRAERYFPNRSSGYGFETDVFLRTLVYEPAGTRYLFQERGMAFTPFYYVQSGGFRELKHPTLELGLRNELLLDGRAKYAFEGSPDQRNNDLDVLRRYRLWLQVGLGWDRDFFNAPMGIFKSNNGSVTSRTALAGFRLRAHFPMLSLGNVFQEDGRTFPEDFERFRKNRFFGSFLTLSYTYRFDARINSLPGGYSIPDNKLLPYPADRFLPAIANNHHVARPLPYGNFYLNFEASPFAIDSVFLTQPGSVDTLVFDLDRTLGNAGSFAVGYVFHFLGNPDMFISSKTDRLIVDPRSNFNYDVFVAGGLGWRDAQLSNRRIALLKTSYAEVGGGIKFGVPKSGIYLTAGYFFILPLRERFLAGMQTIEEFRFRGIQQRHIPYLGISMRNGLTINFKYFYEVESIATEPLTFFDRVGISVGFGG